jgi:hypothetical protein
MKDKILASLKTKFEGVQDAILIRVAEKLSKTVTEDSQLDTALAGITIQKLLESYGDSRATEAADTRENSLKVKFNFTEKATPPTVTTPAPAVTTPGNDDNPLLKQLQDLTARVNGFESKEKQQVLTQKLHDQLKEKKIPVVFAKGYTVEKEEDLQTILGLIETDHTNVKQEYINNGLVTETPIDGTPKATDTAVKADIERLAKKF